MFILKCRYFLLVFGMLHQQGFAQTCCSGGVPLSNNIGGLPISLQNTWQFSFNGDLNILKTVKEGTSVLDDHARERKTFSFLFKTSYSFTDKFFVEGLFSWVQQERKIDQVAGFEDWDRTRGFGDAVILINYNYLTVGNVKLIAGLGPKIPTGPSDLKDEGGLTLNADLQPGKERVLGIIINGKVKVYRFGSFNNGIMIHEDNFEGTDVFIAGSEKHNFMVAFQRTLEDRTKLSFSPGSFDQDISSVIFSDDEANEWDIFGEAINGQRTGQKLKPVTSFIGYWFSWGAFYPRPEIFE